MSVRSNFAWRRQNAALIAQHNPAQDHWELGELLWDLQQNLDVTSREILEIGTHQGGSARVWRDGLIADKVTTICTTDELDRSFSHHGIECIIGRSQDLTHGEMVDFLFIDGGHHLTEVYADFAIYAPCVRKGGAIAFHDVVEVEDVAYVWKMVSPNYKSKLFYAGKDSAGTGTGLLYV